MNKLAIKVETSYFFDGLRRGAKYSFDGIHWLNNGDFSEAMDKLARGYEPVKDGNTSFDAGSDIEELHISVKSSKATLTSCYLGDNYDEIEKNYFVRVASTSWDWVVVIEDTVTIYNMNAEEFKEFMRAWASFDKSRKVIRFKATSGKMIKWLEERA